MASSSKPTKVAASAARERALLLKAQERRAQRRNYVLAVAGMLVAIIAVAFLVKFITASGAVPDSGVLSTPSAADESGGILVNQDGSLGGTPPAGAVRVDVYIDPLCPGCHQFETIGGPTLAAMREEGTVVVYYHPISILDRLSRNTHYSTRAAAAVATVAEYDPAHFEEFFAALFENQPEENSTGLSNAQIEEIATGIGVPGDVAAKFKDGEFTRWVTAATERASVDGLASTPWIRAEQAVDIDSGIWSNSTNLRIVLQYIHDLGLQAYLDSVAAAEADAANPSTTATS